MSDYPEHDKLAAISNKSQTIGEFLDWAGEQGWRLAYYPDDPNYPAEMVWVPGTIQQHLAEYFGIDLDRIEAEKREMLEELRRAMLPNTEDPQ